MSQKASRKSVINEDKEKNKPDSPVKEMKKKIAANAEKERQATEKSTEKLLEKPDKSTEKTADKNADKKTEKNGNLGEKSDKRTEKHDKKPETEPPVEKKDAEKKEEGKGEKNGKPEKDSKPVKPKQNGSQSHNGLSDANGDHATVSDDDDDVMLVIDDDDAFPELTYDDSDVEGFEPPTPEGAPSRSYTRRSQVKAARTPETPRPVTVADNSTDDPKDSKILKLQDDVATDRKLRSADSPKRETRKSQESKKSEKDEKKDEGASEKENGDKSDKVEVEVIVQVENEEGESESRKPDTNYSKSRVKVSPYRRSVRLADQTTSSVMANYTGNNTTMEMDITETSSFAEEPSLDDSSYLSGLRNIRGRRSYKPLKEMTLRHVANRSARSATNVSASEHTRPTGTVVGRKRKPEGGEGGAGAGEGAGEGAAGEGEGEGGAGAHGKRMRLLERIALPFRRTVAAPLPARRAAEIVGINTDLPLTAPVASPAPFDPETLKPEPVPLAPAEPERDGKRCTIM